MLGRIAALVRRRNFEMTLDEQEAARRRVHVAFQRGLLSEAEFDFITRCKAELTLLVAAADHLCIRLCFSNPTNEPIGIADPPHWAAEMKTTAWYYIGVRKEGSTLAATVECASSSCARRVGTSTQPPRMVQPGDIGDRLVRGHR